MAQRGILLVSFTYGRKEAIGLLVVSRIKEIEGNPKTINKRMDTGWFLNGVKYKTQKKIAWFCQEPDLLRPVIKEIHEGYRLRDRKFWDAIRTVATGGWQPKEEHIIPTKTT